MSALRFAVLGNPIAHSKSPDMHNAGYRSLRLPHTYEAIQTDAAGLAGLVDALRRKVYAGYNVTLPHKTEVLKYVDMIEPAAALIGAANTLKLDDEGRVHATNTDLPAIVDELRSLAPEMTAEAWETVDAVVLGTGGAARSAVAALGSTLRVARVVVCGRADANGSVEKVQRFARELQQALAGSGSPTRVEAGNLATPPSYRDIRAIVQTTSAELRGEGAAIARAVAFHDLPPSAVALDVVYTPRETLLLVAARESGIRCANGIGMLARQGALAFEYWLGQAAPYNAMLSAIL